MTHRAWSAATLPPGATAFEKAAREKLRLLEHPVNALAGLHTDTITTSIVVGSDERVLRLGPQTIPAGVTVTLEVGAEMVIL